MRPCECFLGWMLNYIPYKVNMLLTVDGGVHPKHRFLHYHDFFVERVRQSDKVLDIGCGIGALAFDVAEKTRATVLGIDVSETNISQAQVEFAHPLVNYKTGNILEGLPAEHISVIILSNVYHTCQIAQTF